MVVARYEGPTAKHELIGLATGKHYGRKQRGDIVHVDKADVDVYPEMFVVLASPTATDSVKALPQLPTALRSPEQVIRPTGKPIVEVSSVEDELTLDELDATESIVPESSFVLPQEGPKRRRRRRSK